MLDDPARLQKVAKTFWGLSFWWDSRRGGDAFSGGPAHPYPVGSTLGLDQRTNLSRTRRPYPNPLLLSLLGAAEAREKAL